LTPQPVWTLRRREKYFDFSGNRNPLPWLSSTSLGHYTDWAISAPTNNNNNNNNKYSARGIKEKGIPVIT
jgi:hypothetical protein